MGSKAHRLERKKGLPGREKKSQLSSAHRGSQRPRQQSWSLHGSGLILCTYNMVVYGIHVGLLTVRVGL